ncbi:hypothetical protein SK128_022673, partial [Halocaridina rubra]
MSTITGFYSGHLISVFDTFTPLDHVSCPLPCTGDNVSVGCLKQPDLEYGPMVELALLDTPRDFAKLIDKVLRYSKNAVGKRFRL